MQVISIILFINIINFIKKRLQLQFFYMPLPLTKNSQPFSSININHSNAEDDNQSSNINMGQQKASNDFKLPKISIPQSRGRIQSRKSNKVPKYLPLLSNQIQIENQNENAYEQTQNSSHSLHLSQKNKNTTAQNQLQLQQNFPQKSSMPTPKNIDISQPANHFAMEVEQQLKNILGNNNLNIMELQSSNNQYANDQEHSQEDFDFQTKINKNKEIIKMRRQQNEKQKQRKLQVQSNKIIPQTEHNIKINLNNQQQQNSQQHIQNKLKQKPRTKTLKPSTKNQTILQKKMKDYNNSLQNKFLQRKKQSIGININTNNNPNTNIKNQKYEKSLPRAKSKKIVNLNDLLWQDSNNGNSNKNSAYQYQVNLKNKLSDRNGQVHANNNSKKSANLNKKVITEEQSDNQKKAQKNTSLFDNIHSFLQNPKKSQKHQKMLKQLNKKMQNKDINMNQLQQKIKQLNQKMGINQQQNNQTKSTYGKTQKNQNQNQNVFLTSQNNMQKTVRDWKRVQIKDNKNLQYHSSNFDKQIDYINFLQQRNTHSLSKFIDHQKLIVELQLQKKFYKSIEKHERNTQK